MKFCPFVVLFDPMSFYPMAFDPRLFDPMSVNHILFILYKQSTNVKNFIVEPIIVSSKACILLVLNVF